MLAIADMRAKSPANHQRTKTMSKAKANTRRTESKEFAMSNALSKLNTLVTHDKYTGFYTKEYLYELGKTIRKYADQCDDDFVNGMDQMLALSGQKVALAGWLGEEIDLTPDPLEDRVQMIKNRVGVLICCLQQMADDITDLSALGRSEDGLTIGVYPVKSE